MPYGNHAIISNMVFIVTDQTDLLKETEIFLTWLLLLSVCHCHSSILHHRQFLTTFLFHCFLLLRSFGQQHTIAEHFLLSAVFLVYVARQSLIFCFYLLVSILYCHLRPTFPSTFHLTKDPWPSFSSCIQV